MMTYATPVVFSLLTTAIALGLFRLARGPSVIDRIMAFDLITTSAVGMIVMLSIRWETELYIDLILIFSLLGFFGTVAFVIYLHRSYEVESQPQRNEADTPQPERHVP